MTDAINTVEKGKAAYKAGESLSTSFYVLAGMFKDKNPPQARRDEFQKIIDDGEDGYVLRALAVLTDPDIYHR